MFLSILTFGMAMFMTIGAAKSETKEEVMKYLVNRNIMELQIDSTTNEAIYKLTPEADSTGWRQLYFYLNDTK